MLQVLDDVGELRKALIAVPGGLVKSKPGLYESICGSISSDLVVWPYGNNLPVFELLTEEARQDLNFRAVRTSNTIIVARRDYHVINTLSPDIQDRLNGCDYDSADCFRMIHGLLDLFILLLGPDELGVYAITGKQDVVDKVFQGFKSKEIEFFQWVPSESTDGRHCL